MPKRPFSIRLEERSALTYKAIATVLGIPNDVMLEQMLEHRKSELSEGQLHAVKSLLDVWQKKED